MKINTLSSIIFALALLAGTAACKKDAVDTPVSLPPPQQQLPNPLPANALVAEIKWANTDFTTFDYNNRGQVERTREQWQYESGDTGKIRVITHHFRYDALDRPVQIDVSGGFAVKYYYRGNLIDKTEERYPGGAIAREVQYHYADNRIVRETWQVNGLPGESATTYQILLTYDLNGNLAKVETYDDQQLHLLETVTYSDFDDAVNPVNWMLRYPYLPQLRWQFNNPRKEVRQLADGSIETVIYQYEYNTDHLPVLRRKYGPGGTSTMQYRY